LVADNRLLPEPQGRAWQAPANHERLLAEEKMTLPIVPRAVAEQAKVRHQFVPGLGYLAHSGPPELGPQHNGNLLCAPLPSAQDGSRHMLKPPGYPPMQMVWSARECAWAHPAGKGNRMAWPVDHLSRAGWAYLNPV
jgi:hypothetical protein